MIHGYTLMDIVNKNIVITGASSGIGYSILRACLDFDCRIIATAQNREKLEKVIAPFSDRVIPFAGNIGEQATVDRLFEFALDRLGSVDIFFANAGFAYYESLQRPDWSHLEQIFSVNTFSPIYSLLKMNELNQGRSWKTVMINSAMAEWALPGYAVYGATKSAVNHFSKSNRFDASGRHVLMVYPIATITNFFETAGRSVPLPYPVQQPDVVARKIIRAVLSDQRILYPSMFFRFLLISRRFFPFIETVYQQMQSTRFRRWLKEGVERQ